MFPGGKRKAVRHKMFSLWVRAEGPREGNKTPPTPSVSRAKWREDTGVQAEGEESCTGSGERVVVPENRILLGWGGYVLGTVSFGHDKNQDVLVCRSLSS